MYLKIAVAWLWMMVAILGCVPQTRPMAVRFAEVEPSVAASYSSSDTLPLRVAVAAVVSPKGTVESYSDLLAYIGKGLDRPVQLVQRQTYAEVNDLLARGEVDLAFVCTSAYVAGQRDFGMELLVAPQVNGETVYFSLLIVPASSSAHSMRDLRGKTFAFTDPLSLTGRVYPTNLVQALAATPETFFGRTFFTYSHDNAIRAVANQVADGANVDSLVYDFFVARDALIRDKVRVIDRSPAFGIPPVVVNPKLDPQLKIRLREILLNADRDEMGKQVLKNLMIERFVLVPEQLYDSARELESQVNSAP